MTRDTTPRQDIYTRVTDSIIAELEKGVRPWEKPWSAEHAAGRVNRPLRHNGVPYAGINILMLWTAALEHGFASPMWMTFRQAKELGAHVRKGEKGSPVVYANTITRTDETDEGETVEQHIPFIPDRSPDFFRRLRRPSFGFRCRFFRCPVAGPGGVDGETGPMAA
ncbi:ArdC-like ssDNA-binding domain-containing protein [Roseospira visakhapatnamensis]|uniref:Antirestriction protein ArdC n=1 Tax=Roseospira visakhapatnamensis TaxID=390880 RepID=A0A7W6RFY8_9PROT|nr:ArdC-like ssDNA-binding domain-containing protein [Roseospira visakhapatnamensis]MBB4267178.1 antirestriction protein ArdC [Roseospira visakhapatnamensis]